MDKYNKICIICGIDQTTRAKEGIGLMLAVFPTDADKKLDGKPQALCRRCFKKYFNQ